MYPPRRKESLPKTTQSHLDYLFEGRPKVTHDSTKSEHLHSCRRIKRPTYPTGNDAPSKDVSMSGRRLPHRHYFSQSSRTRCPISSSSRRHAVQIETLSNPPVRRASMNDGARRKKHPDTNIMTPHVGKRTFPIVVATSNKPIPVKYPKKDLHLETEKQNFGITFGKKLIRFAKKQDMQDSPLDLNKKTRAIKKKSLMGQDMLIKQLQSTLQSKKNKRTGDCDSDENGSVMDADSSYGGSDTAQDLHSSLDNSHNSQHNNSKHDHHDKITTAVHVVPDAADNDPPVNNYYHKNEITVPVNLDQTDFQKNTDTKLPHYLATANLNINESLENHNNLEEMSRNYKSQHKLHDSFSKKSTSQSLNSGIDNPAFIEDAKSTFNNDMPYSNGLVPDPSKTNNREPVTEAVNLELINMKPGSAIHNGKNYDNSGMTTIPLKKDEDDIRSPYDEYFVPVNEHRKYMRGEKLYVTKDNRVEKSKGKCICWTLCIVLVATAVLIGILAAAGLIGYHAPMPQAVEVSGRSFENDTPINKGGFSIPGIGQKQPLTPEPPISTVNPIPPTTDESLIQVPRVIESEITIDNLNFNSDLLYKNNTEYKALSENLEQYLKAAIFTEDELKNGPMEISVKIITLKPGSVIAKYRVSWKFKEKPLLESNPREIIKDPIDEESLNKRLKAYLEKHNNLLETYHVPQYSIRSQKVLDKCKIQNNGCHYMCYFDYDDLDFKCICPEGQILDQDNKSCKDYIEKHTEYATEQQSDEHRGLTENTFKVDNAITTEPPTNPEPLSNPEPTGIPDPETTVHELANTGDSISVTVPQTAFPLFNFTMDTSKETDKDRSMEFSVSPRDYSQHNSDITETTKSPNSIFSAIPIEFPTEKSSEESQSSTTENTVQQYFTIVLSGAITEKPKTTTDSYNGPQDFYYNPSQPESEEKEDLSAYTVKNEAMEKGSLEYRMGNVYTPPAEVHYDLSTKKNGIYMIQVLKPIIHKEAYREPKIQELHMNPENSTELEKNVTDHHLTGSMDPSEHIHDEYMSPFLPELENDTFVNSLHSEEHLVDHENHDHISTVKSHSVENGEQISTTVPPKSIIDILLTLDSTTTNGDVVSTTNDDVVTMTNDDVMTTTNDDVVTTTNDDVVTTTNDDVMTTTNDGVSITSMPLSEGSTKSPSLEFDQLNKTNPFDNDTSDAGKIKTDDPNESKDLEIEPIKPEVVIIISDKRGEPTTEVPTTTEYDTTEVTTTKAFPITPDYHELPNVNNISGRSNQEIVADIITTTEITIATTDEDVTDNVTAKVTNAVEETTTIENITTDNVYSIIQNFRMDNDTMNEATTTESGKVDDQTITTVIDNIGNENVTVLEYVTTTEENNLSHNEITIINNANETSSSVTNIDDKNETVVDTTALPTTDVPAITTVKETEINFNESTTVLNEVEISSAVENKTDHVSNFNDITSSTEDLIALETTTNVDGDSTPLDVNEVKINKMQLHENTIDIAAETVETATTFVNVKNNDDKDVENEISTQTNQVTTVETKQYEVKESLADLTTTEKLFVTHKPTTESVQMEENPTEELGIIPLSDAPEERKQKKYSSFESNEISDEKTENKVVKHPLITENDDIKPVTEDFELPKSSRCSVGQFQCVNGTSVKDGSYCIPIGDRCDSVLDCTDASDEVHCYEEGCPNNFQCASKQCLKRHLVCDGILNCNDGSDEINCESWTCNSDELSCGALNRCIPITWKCDGRKHCPDGSDEKGCLHSGPCPGESFRCSEESSCMPNSWKCDGQLDCPGGEDEMSCSCTAEQFKCNMGGGCIPLVNRCDGIAQCSDKSDEWNCIKIDNLSLNVTEANDKKILQIQVENNTWYPICMDWTIWKTSFADLVCQNLGYSASATLESVPKPKNSTSTNSYILNILSEQEQSLRFVENKIPNCDQFVSISCQEYVCGSPAPLEVSSARIVGGDKAAPTQWPSLALLYNKRSNIYCTSTLVTPLWAVTSYSCVAGQTSHLVHEDDWFLYAGGTNKGDNSTSQVRRIKEIVFHPQTKFSNFGFKNDAVLLKLRKPLNINVNVSAVCLPNSGIEPRQLCVVAGWGINKPGEPSIQQYLHYLPVPLIDTTECNSTRHYNGKITADKICAGYTDSDKTPCFNDEGAPLMCFSDKSATWELHGLLSHHGNCGSTNKHPAIYTAINPSLRTWMTNIIGREALATT